MVPIKSFKRYLVFVNFIGLTMLILLFVLNSKSVLEASKRPIDIVVFDKESRPKTAHLKSQPIQRNDGGVKTNWLEKQKDIPKEPSVDPEIQEVAKNLFQKHNVPIGVFVAIEPATGKILALVESAGQSIPAEKLYFRAIFPAASVFKIISTAAIIEKKPALVHQEVCYHGGMRTLTAQNILDNRGRDNICIPFFDALGFSANSVYGKMGVKHLSNEILLEYGEKFFFNKPIPADVAVDVSQLFPSQNQLELARMTAGFVNTHMSPFHGAVIAMIIANKGKFIEPYLYQPKPTRKKIQVIPEAKALLLQKMMLVTTERGTAKRYLKKGIPASKNRWIKVAAKTGSLIRTEPWFDYSWIVGFAPYQQPRIAFCVLVANKEVWRVRANFVAQELLKQFFNR